MFEMFASWEWWQIALTAVFGTMWIVFIVLDKRRKIAAKKLKARWEQELKAQGYSDEQIKEIMKQKGPIYIFQGEQGSGMSLHSVVQNSKDGEKIMRKFKEFILSSGIGLIGFLTGIFLGNVLFALGVILGK